MKLTSAEVDVLVVAVAEAVDKMYWVNSRHELSPSFYLTLTEAELCALRELATWLPSNRDALELSIPECSAVVQMLASIDHALQYSPEIDRYITQHVTYCVSDQLEILRVLQGLLARLSQTMNGVSI